MFLKKSILVLFVVSSSIMACKKDKDSNKPNINILGNSTIGARDGFYIADECDTGGRMGILVGKNLFNIVRLALANGCRNGALTASDIKFHSINETYSWEEAVKGAKENNIDISYDEKNIYFGESDVKTVFSKSDIQLDPTQKVDLQVQKLSVSKIASDHRRISFEITHRLPGSSNPIPKLWCKDREGNLLEISGIEFMDSEVLTVQAEITVGNEQDFEDFPLSCEASVSITSSGSEVIEDLANSKPFTVE